jgi:hypothetical protein
LENARVYASIIDVPQSAVECLISRRLGKKWVSSKHFLLNSLSKFLQKQQFGEEAKSKTTASVLTNSRRMTRAVVRHHQTMEQGKVYFG